MGASRRRLNAEGIRRELVVVGTSLGGIEALTTLFGGLRPGLRATVVVVMHRGPLFDEGLLTRLVSRRSSLTVSEPADGEEIEHGRAYVAPRDQHLLIEDGLFRLHRGPREHYARPAVDPLFRSAAAARGRAVLGILLTGGGDDGVGGLIAIRKAGGLGIAQTPGAALDPSMPCSAILRDHVDAVLSLERIGEAADSLARGEVFEIEAAEWGRRRAERGPVRPPPVSNPRLASAAPFLRRRSGE